MTAEITLFPNVTKEPEDTSLNDIMLQLHMQKLFNAQQAVLNDLLCDKVTELVGRVIALEESAK